MRCRICNKIIETPSFNNKGELDDCLECVEASSFLYSSQDIEELEEKLVIIDCDEWENQ